MIFKYKNLINLISILDCKDYCLDSNYHYMQNENLVILDFPHNRRPVVKQGEKYIIANQFQLDYYESQHFTDSDNVKYKHLK